MSDLNREQKEQVFDYYFKCTSQEDIERGAQLTASNEEAARLYKQLGTALSGLESIRNERCPDDLVELTVEKLKLATSAASLPDGVNLGDLLLAEEQKTGKVWKIKIPMWRNYAQVAAAAATILIITTIGLPMFSSMRQKSWQTICQGGLRNVGAGMLNYANDNSDRLAMLSVPPGSPWWKVGQQGEENHSNTRYLWQMVRCDYADGKDFICPGHRNSQAVVYDSVLMGGYSDFPSRRNLSYSLTLTCERGGSPGILMSDRNPLFANISGCSDSNKDEFTRIILDRDLRQQTSPNHPGRGQNILSYDGAVRFTPSRMINGDDIFTVRNIDCYYGREIPSDQKDVFLVP